MNNQRAILESIIKYAAIIVALAFFIRMGLRFQASKEILTASGIRMILMVIGFGTLYALRHRLTFNVLAILTMLIVYAGLIIYPLYGFPINPGGLMLFLLSVIMISIIPLAIYHPIDQKWQIIFWNVLFLTSFFVVLSQTDRFLDPASYKSFSYLFKKELMLGFALIGSYAAINWIIYQYQLFNFKAQSKIESINAEIQTNIDLFKSQTILLSQKKEALNQSQKKLLEAKSSLQNEVKKETEKVNERTKLLLKLSFINSHYLRVPISRIKSVLLVWDEIDKNKRQTIINDSITELRSVIDTIININKREMDVDTAEEYLKRIQLNKPSIDE